MIFTPPGIRPSESLLRQVFKASIMTAAVEGIKTILAVYQDKKSCENEVWKEKSLVEIQLGAQERLREMDANASETFDSAVEYEEEDGEEEEYEEPRFRLQKRSRLKK